MVGSSLPTILWHCSTSWCGASWCLGLATDAVGPQLLQPGHTPAFHPPHYRSKIPCTTCSIPELLPLPVAHESCPHHRRRTVPLIVPLPSLQLQPGLSSSQEASKTFVWAVQSNWDEAPTHPLTPPEAAQGHGYGTGVWGGCRERFYSCQGSVCGSQHPLQPQNRVVNMARQCQGFTDPWEHFCGWYELPGSQELSPFCLQLLDLQAHFAL